LNSTRKQVISAPPRLRQQARYLYQRMGVSSTPTLIIFHLGSPLTTPTEICEAPEPTEQKNQRIIFSEV
jgi:hypothetical protein